ncbi:MAG: 5'/3'-nucleotidase SurE [Bacteroidales bacterium]|nr:5'/3'-nucleotidase SurE [Bacteroidales bacterium]
MEILITNDDGYKSKGIRVLAEIMSSYGNVTVVAPKNHQSGMSMAVNLGGMLMEYKKLSKDEAPTEAGSWAWLDAYPTSCAKFALNLLQDDKRFDLVVSGVNHGSNASTASCYSATLGATQEGALHGIPSIGFSIDSLDPDADFSPVEKYLPLVLEKILNDLPQRKGIYYNVNFPAIPADKVKGLRVATMGSGKWVREFKQVSGDMDSGTWVMVGEYVDGSDNPMDADHHLMEQGYISIVAHNIDNTDRAESDRLHERGFDIDF